MRGLLSALLAALLGLALLLGDPQMLEPAGSPPPVTASRIPSYDRDAFGSGWIDADRDGCNTRMEVLQRDLERERVTRDCKVVGGAFRDPYTGVGGEALASVLDIDHVVSLGDAWRSGAWSWTREQRRRFSNDERNLVATAAAQNRAKADLGPAKWVPTNETHHCAFARQIDAVKRRYRLAVSPADRAALDRLLETC